MIINDNYLNEIEDYYAITLEKNEGLNSLVMTDNENSKYVNALQRIYNHYLISNDKAELISLQRRANNELQKYDFIILDTDTTSKISTAEKLKVITKRISIEAGKNITAAYVYVDSGVKRIKLFYHTPTYSSSEKYDINSDNFNINNLLDLVSYKHNEHNSEKTFAPYRKK